MKKIIKAISIIMLIFLMIFSLNCYKENKELKRNNNLLSRQNAIIKIYDNNSNLINKIESNSISIESLSLNNNSNNMEKTTVFTINANNSIKEYTGDSLILADNKIYNYLENCKEDLDKIRSYDLLINIKNSFKEDFQKKDMVILIRSKSGKPLATYIGNDITFSSFDKIYESSKIIIDDMYLFIYRCNYTIYEIDSLNQI